MEHGLSDNTLNSLQGRYKCFDSIFTSFEDKWCSHVREEHLEQFLSKAAGKAEKKPVKRLSSVRRYYGFLLREKIISLDPSRNLTSKRLGRSLLNTERG